MTAEQQTEAAFFHKATESERGLLSCLRGHLHETGALVTQSGLTSEMMLHYPTIFDCLMGLWRDGKPYDFLTVVNSLRADGQFFVGDSMRAGHGAFTQEQLSALLYDGQSAIHAPTFIHAVFECHAARRMVAVAQRLLHSARDVTGSMAGLLDEARAELAGLSVHPIAKRTRLQDFLQDVLSGIETISDPASAMDFGIGLDDKAGPFCPGDLIVIAGETGRGKSALAGNIVENVASAGGKCAVFSLEMTGVQNAERMLASQARVDIRSMKLRRRLMRHQPTLTTQDQMEERRMMVAVTEMAKWDVQIIESTFNLQQIVAEMIRLKTTRGLNLTVVDYTQLVEGTRDKGDNREREVASISKLLKRAAVQTGSIVLLLSQLNDDGRLRESRAIGQDANCVLFIEGDAANMKIRVGKARSAPSGTEIALNWQSSFTRFTEK